METSTPVAIPTRRAQSACWLAVSLGGTCLPLSIPLDLFDFASVSRLALAVSVSLGLIVLVADCS